MAHRLVRGKNVVLSTVGYQVLRRFPRAGRRILRRQALDRLPEEFAVDTHFSPRYDPWDQRLCVAPDGDLFDVLSDGRAEVVTDTIERFERDGIRLRSGVLLPADLVVTATGLRIEVGGGAEVVLDGVPLDVSSAHVYKGLMLSGVPNLALALGYTNASWTLRADLSARWFCSLLRHLDRHGYAVATPRYDEQPVEGEEVTTPARPHLRVHPAWGSPDAPTGSSAAVASRPELSLRPRGHAARPDRRRAPGAALTCTAFVAGPLAARGGPPRRRDRIAVEAALSAAAIP